MRIHSLAVAALLCLPATAAAAPATGARPGKLKAPPSGGTHGYIEVPPEELTQANGAEISNVLFINRCVGGCTVQAGPNDARNDTSSIVDGTTFLSEFAYGDDSWNAVIACLEEIFLPFDVVITQEDPAPAFHHEAIVAGSTAELGMPGVLGVAPIACNGALNNVISFSLANSHGNSPRYICETVAQEMAHAFGLDHEFDCHDPMTYLSPCGDKYYRDASFACGRYEQEPCICGGAGQNSHRKLLGVFGQGPGAAPPTAEIQLPDDGATVEGEFSIYALGTDIRGNKRAELRINGYKWQELDAPELFEEESQYRFTAPASLPDGYQNIEVRIYNDLDVPTNASIQVLKGAPCTSADTCLDGQSCNAGACAWPEPTGALGDACERNQDCIGDLCPTLEGESLCSQDCTPGVTGSCPMEYECIGVGGGSGVCWPAGGGGGGCCSLGGQRTGWVQLVLFAAVVLLVSTRRRRPH
jgi:hypothetical protein